VRGKENVSGNGQCATPMRIANERTPNNPREKWKMVEKVGESTHGARPDPSISKGPVGYEEKKKNDRK
jgi:hypothetical protein